MQSSPQWQAELARITAHLEALDLITLAQIAHMPIPDKEELTERGIQISLARGVLRRKTGLVVKDEG